MGHRAAGRTGAKAIDQNAQSWATDYRPLELTAIDHMIVAMQRRLPLIALMAMAAMIFAPEIRDAGAFLVAKSVEANAIRIIDGLAFAVGCL